MGKLDILFANAKLSDGSKVDIGVSKGLIVDMITEALARIRGQHPVGITVGAPADLCFVTADSIPEAIVSRPKRKLVVKGGKIKDAHSIIFDERKYK